jgi:hypothetical protein
MVRKLSSLGPEELLAAVHGGELDELQVLEVLRNPHCTPEIAVQIADSPHWTGSHGVRELLVGHRGFPFARAMSLLPTLPWTSLLQLAQVPRTPPVVRRQAEKKLLDRLTKMSLGEKIALARRAHRPLFQSLMATTDEQVLSALLDNPRVVETDVILMVNTSPAPPEFYFTLGRHHRWSLAYGVRLALAECARAPLPLVLSAMVQLNPMDLCRLADRRDLPERIRGAAETLWHRRRLTTERK